MNKTLQQRARTLAIGVGLGAMMAIPVATLVPSVASADSTCYTGCTGSTGGSSLPFTNGPTTPPAATPTGTTSSLPFTGADLGELSVIGVGALGAGAVLLRRSRRRRTA